MDFREMDFQRADRRYAELKQQHDAGALSDAELDALLALLTVQDDEGRWWSKSRETGEWHYHEGSTWLRETPPSYQPVASGEPTGQTERQQTEPERQDQRKRTEVLGAIAAAVAGVAWLVLSINPNFGPTLFFVALTGTLGGLVGLHARQATSYGRLGLAGSLVVFLGTILLILSIAGFTGGSAFVSGSDFLAAIILIAFPLGILGALVGFVLSGIATLRARVLPDWCGFLLITNSVVILIFFIRVFFAFVGPGPRGVVGDERVLEVLLLLGLVWLGLGYALWSKRRVSGKPPRGAS